MSTESDEIVQSEATEQETNGIPEAAEKLVTALFDVGRLWAAHGLSVGRSALEASAQTLRTTAEILREVSSKLEPEER